MILLLGGTSESLKIADLLNQKRLSYLLSVVSDYGLKVAQKHSSHVIKQILTETNFQEFCQKNRITYVLDATHPFAREISQLAINQTSKLGIPYLRFERESLYENESHLKSFDSVSVVISYLKNRSGLVYLSTGSKTAGDFATLLGIQRLHVRVLPTVKVLLALTEIGFTAAQIDALEGPFSQRLNEELFLRAHASWVVTKESGRQGGFVEKLSACQNLKLPCLVIRRPPISYPVQVNSLKDLELKLEAQNVR